MKKSLFPSLAALVALVAVAATLRAPRNTGAYDVVAFSRLPTLVNGRLKPLDTVARTTLLVTQGRQRVTAPDGSSLTPGEWLLDVLYRPKVADTYQTFEIVHPDLLALFSLTTADGAGGKRFSAQQLSGHLAELERQSKLAYDTESPLRTPFQSAVVQLRESVILYQRLQNSLNDSTSPDFLDRVALFQKALPSGLAATAPRGGANPGASADAKLLLEMSSVFSSLDSFAYLRTIPSEKPDDPTGWKTAGGAWSESLATGRIAPAAVTFADLGRAWQNHQPEAFNQAVRTFRASLDASMPAVMRKCDVEARFNSSQPFYTSMALYVAAFLLAVVSWLKWPTALGQTAFAFVLIAFVIATAGIGARMWLEARPPVTNLYSSALFVGWGAVALCLVLEYFFRNAIGSVAAGLVGFATLLIAHHLALGGDTMEMMRAVLDSNFWLATHVVTVTIGYSATFLAGFLALIYVLRGTLTRSLSKETADALNRMVYGIVCFATLFSFVGTVLGGIWADQSWGRFWGWDPKENGAL
ncbi:MAG: cytochrome c biogenesis protein CcsA, partial [Verrucomicrobia bacterium]|nr:cytochrome c biogenesis protein CcsA [Verrucomicrobiota bacterium]